LAHWRWHEIVIGIADRLLALALVAPGDRMSRRHAFDARMSEIAASIGIIAKERLRQ
jgi:hypothetical protein